MHRIVSELIGVLVKKDAVVVYSKNVSTPANVPPGPFNIIHMNVVPRGTMNTIGGTEN